MWLSLRLAAARGTSLLNEKLRFLEAENWFQRFLIKLITSVFVKQRSIETKNPWKDEENEERKS